MITPSHPKAIRLEASTHCQLKCPACPTAQGKINQKLGGGFLTFEMFQKLIDQNPSVVHIELSNWGEIFLNPNLVDIMAYAYQKDVMLTASNGANLNTVKPDVLEALVKYKFRHITCSIDGASQETYSQYRIGGNFTRVIENIKSINHYKSKYQSEFPILSWQFIVFGHNEHEIETAKSLARSLNMQFWIKLSWNEQFSPVRNKELIREQTSHGAASQSEYQQKHNTAYMQKMFCTQLWRQPQVNWDGRVLGCCVNYWSDFGNAFESDLDTVLNGEKMTYAKKMLFGQVEARAGIPCTDCKYYQVMSKNRDWLTPGDIKHSLKYRLAYSLGRLGVTLIDRLGFIARLYVKALGNR